MSKQKTKATKKVSLLLIFLVILLTFYLTFTWEIFCMRLTTFAGCFKSILGKFPMNLLAVFSAFHEQVEGNYARFPQIWGIQNLPRRLLFLLISFFHHFISLTSSWSIKGQQALHF
jgi:hypothetical protein